MPHILRNQIGLGLIHICTAHIYLLNLAVLRVMCPQAAPVFSLRMQGLENEIFSENLLFILIP
jgi:hypothetical protein